MDQSRLQPLVFKLGLTQTLTRLRRQVLLTETHLALVMEYAAGNSLTGYVADKWQHAQHTGLFLGEDEARYFFKVRALGVRGQGPRVGLRITSRKARMRPELLPRGLESCACAWHVVVSVAHCCVLAQHAQPLYPPGTVAAGTLQETGRSAIALRLMFQGWEVHNVMVSRRNRASVTDTCVPLQQFINAVAYCHGQNVAHRWAPPPVLGCAQLVFNTL